MASFRKRKTAKGYSFQARVYDTLTETHITRTFSTEREAKTWARNKEVERSENKNSCNFNCDLTLGQAAQKYINQIVLKNHKHPNVAVSRINRTVERLGSDSLLVALSPKTFTEFRDQRLKSKSERNTKKQVTTGTVRKELADISMIYKTAIKEWHYSELVNPLDTVTRPANSKPRKRRLEKGEFEKLVDGSRRVIKINESFENGKQRPRKYADVPWVHPQLDSMIIIYANLGLRRSELFFLNWENIDFKRKLIEIIDGKTGDRTVPLIKIVHEEFKKIGIEKGGRIFKLNSVDNISTCFGQLCNYLKIKDLRLHDLRHEATSRLSELDLNLLEIASVTGHKDLKTLQGYTHTDTSRLAKKMDKQMK